MPHLKELVERYEDEGLVLIGVHTPNGWDKAPDFVDANGIQYPVAHDVRNETIEAYEVNSYPDYYVIDRAGDLRFADLANKELDRAVEFLLQESAEDVVDLTEALEARIEAQPRFELEVRMGERIVSTVEMEYSLEEIDGELCVRHVEKQGGPAVEGEEETVASAKSLALRSLSGSRSPSGPDAEDEEYAYEVRRGRLVGRRSRAGKESEVDVELPAGTLTHGLALLRGSLLPFEPGASAEFRILVGSHDPPSAHVEAAVRYAGESDETIGEVERSVHVVEVVEDGNVEVRMFLDDDRRLLGVDPVVEGPEVRVITPAGGR